MRKSIFLTGAILLSSVALFAQDCAFYYPKTEGKQLEFTSYDAKDKVTGSSIQLVKEVTESGGVQTVLIEAQSFDKKGKDLSKNEFTAKCENGFYAIDMKSFMDAQTMAAYEDMDVDISGNKLEIPAKLKVGDELPNGTLSFTIYSEGTKIMSTTTSFTKRTVEAKEEVTTEAGTFDCYKITYTMNVNSMFSVRMEVADWICEDVGTVKSETYSRGKKMSYTLLTGIN